MAKKKEEKEEKKKGLSSHTELVGLLFILISIVGICEFGPVGNIISSFALFLVGSYYQIILVWLAYVAVMMIINRKAPNFFTSRMIGLYVLFLAILILSHLEFIEKNSSLLAVLSKTVENLMQAFTMGHNNIAAGGGIIGALFAILCNSLFAEGSYVVIGALMLFGVIMLFNVSLSDMVKAIIKGFKKFVAYFKKGRKEEEKKNAALEEENKKVVISSIGELTQANDHSTHEEVEAERDNVLSLEGEKSNSLYKLPPLVLLDVPKRQSNTNQGAVQNNIETLQKVFKDFEIDGKVVEVHVGPSVTQYELELKAGTKVNRVLSINREIALALAAKNVRIQAPIPGKNTIGIELPNRVNTAVSLRDVLSNMPSAFDNSKLAVGLGKDIMGKNIYAEINKTPHLLIAGATGSGKSVCINTIIISILMRCRPDEVKLVLVDPKKVELSIYNGIPHLLSPVVTDPKKASIALMKIVSEMESRYDLFSETESKSIVSYNQQVEEQNKHLPDGEKIKKLPYIVVIIDELADLMLVAAKEVEDSIMRITQMARAAGIHLIVATQRPSTDVITGIIKANIPSRISFAVSSNVDSRTILDQSGAEKLLGKGDMLFLPMGENVPLRLQGCFVSDGEVKRIVDFTIKQQKAQYDERMMITDEKPISNNGHDTGEDDPLYNEIVEFAVKNGTISASLIQRKYRFGYNRAARVIDTMENRGIVGPPNGSKPREVLVKLEESNEEEDGV
ncbi:MAG: DNA translocase FtsK [Bacilli bacterium]|nr:DNA translocase FtsK [Bacilli bacterium]MDD3304628.1 DNA translocase FtsK [Bacilli bacterium]MDD4053541.1 DNA translocase FtsK [Bacilli bacterium]MDD4411492.1 DNA translocase FtsK [Bacilli bacterium]